MPVVKLPEAARKKDRKCGRYKFFFYSDEGDEPAHIHVEDAGKRAKYWLTPQVSLVANRSFNPAELSEIRRCIERYRELFINRYNEHLGRDSL